MSRPRKCRRQPDQSSVGPSPLVSTYQTRIAVYEGRDRAEGDAGLSAYAELYGRVQRKLFADVVAGRSAASLKRDYIKKHGIPARLFNAVRVPLDGKVASVRGSQRLCSRTVCSGGLIGPSGRFPMPLSGADGIRFIRRSGGSLIFDTGWLDWKPTLRRAGSDCASGRRSCGVSSITWSRMATTVMRNGCRTGKMLSSDEFFVLGSRDETSGCQLCVASIADDGSLTLRLPDCLAEQHGKYLVIEGVRFAYGHEQVLAGLQSNAEYAAHRREHGDKAARATVLGQAISYRFKRDGKGWRVFVSTQMMDVPVVTDRRRGAIGVDLNADHLAVADTDASGNYLKAWQVPLVTYGKSQHQAEALIGDAVASVVEYAREVGKPIVIEKLDFRQKKATLEGQSRKYTRMLSSFSYGKIKAYFISRGYRQGVEVKQVNPAFSSIVGRVKFMERYGLTIHQAAALVLARRSLGYSERIPRRWVCPVGNGVSGRLHRTREEEREARVDVLGRGVGTTETGACSAASAGETQSGSG